MTAYPDKVDVEQVFQQLTPAADPQPRRPPPSDDSPGLWRVVSEDGSTSTFQPAEEVEPSCGGLLSRSVPAAPLRQGPCPCKLASGLGEPSDSPCGKVTPAEAQPPNAGTLRLAADLKATPLDEPSAARPNIGMPRPTPQLSDDLDADAAPERNDPNAALSGPGCLPPEALPAIDSGGNRPAARIGQLSASADHAGVGGHRQTPLRVCPWAFLSRDEIDPDLVRIVDIWPRLARQIREAILAILNAIKRN